jgi:hypothetical protein
VADHVFGARVFGFRTRFPSYRFAMGGRLTTAAANLVFDSCLTDMHTCLKLVPLEHFRCLALVQQGFGLDTELTAMMLRAGIRPYEVPITYNGRTLDQGKKISWLDGLSCLRILMSVRMRKAATLPSGPFGQVRITLVASPPSRSLHLDDEPDWEMLDAAT